MEPFLKQVARKFIESGKNISNYCFVFPNQRAGIFFQKYLSELCNKPFFAPHITMMNEFFRYQNKGIIVDDRLGLLFRLYTIYKTVKEENNKEVEDFDQFIHFGEILLSDFNDIDNYIVDAKQLYTVINDLKELEDPAYSYLNDEQRKILKDLFGNDGNQKEYSRKFFETWNLLADIYTKFKEDLLNNRLAYDGMLNRMAVENIESIETNFEKVIFIGFNAINEVQRRMFKLLGDKADFYWDYASKQIQDKENKASFFMKENLNNFKSEYTLEKEEDKMPNFDIWSIPSATMQTKIVEQKLNELGDVEKNKVETAVILADESLLLPVLYSIPKSIKKINVTMGYPMRITAVEQLIIKYIQLQYQIKKCNDGIPSYFFKFAQEILKHPYIKRNSPTEVANLNYEIRKNNMIYVSEDFIKGKNIEILNKIFNKSNDVLESIAQIMDYLYESNNLNSWEKEFTKQTSEIIRRTNKLIKEWQFDLKENTLIHIIHQLLYKQSIAFKGEPLEGLQVMGMLETRCLDFKNIIITSLNEGVFPRTNISTSYIPYTLRHSFGLPTTEHQDAIFAYHFYRLISRAENVTLIYNNLSSGVSQSGEESRYIKQLRYLYGVNCPINIVSIDSSEEKNNDKPHTQEIQKTDEEINILHEKKFSPSALKNYIKCNKLFYYSNVRGIHEYKDLSEDLKPNEFGNIFHKAMEIIYGEYKNQIVDEQLIKKMGSDNNLNSAIEKAFKENQIEGSQIGRNKIIFEIIKFYIQRTLNYDKSRAPFTYISGEEVYKLKLNNYNLIGTIDRIDKKDDTTCICDYKTGSDSITNCSIDDLFKGSNDAEFQLYMYALMYLNRNINQKNITTYLYAIKKEYGEVLVNANIDEFKCRLIELLDEICDKEKTFKPTDDNNICKYCPYSLLCK